jgi:hypothetical protein
VAKRNGKAVARSTPKAVRAGRQTVTLRFTATAKRSLRRNRSVSLSVRVTVGGAAATLTTRLGR